LGAELEDFLRGDCWTGCTGSQGECLLECENDLPEELHMLEQVMTHDPCFTQCEETAVVCIAMCGMGVVQTIASSSEKAVGVAAARLSARATARATSEQAVGSSDSDDNCWASCGVNFESCAKTCAALTLSLVGHNGGNAERSVGHRHAEKAVGYRHVERSIGHRHAENAVGYRHAEKAVGHRSSATQSTVAMQTSDSGFFDTAVTGFAALGLAVMVYGSFKYYCGSKMQ